MAFPVVKKFQQVITTASGARQILLQRPHDEQQPPTAPRKPFELFINYKPTSGYSIMGPDKIVTHSPMPLDPVQGDQKKSTPVRQSPQCLAGLEIPSTPAAPATFGPRPDYDEYDEMYDVTPERISRRVRADSAVVNLISPDDKRDGEETIDLTSDNDCVDLTTPENAVGSFSLPIDIPDEESRAGSPSPLPRPPRSHPFPATTAPRRSQILMGTNRCIPCRRSKHACEGGDPCKSCRKQTRMCFWREPGQSTLTWTSGTGGAEKRQRLT